MFFTIINFIKNMFFFTGAYSNQVFKDPLTKEEEEILLEKLKEKDKNARDLLIEHNLRLVAHIAKKYQSEYYDQDDLIGIGTIGLIKGIDSYSNEKGTKLTTYCARCIENEILMYFRKDNKHTKNVSLNQSIGFDKDGNEISLIDILKIEEQDLIDKIDTKDNVSKINKYYKCLTKREKEIIKRRYGLDNSEEETQINIANDMNISRSYVSRLEKRALTKMLREYLKKEK